MNPKYDRQIKRLKDLIAQGKEVAALEIRDRDAFNIPYIPDHIRLNGWLVSADNIIRTTFGLDSAHFLHFSEIVKGRVDKAADVNRVIGVLTGGVSDLDGGFLVRQELLVAAVVLDSVLEQAKHLSRSGFKDPSAVLGRVVVEDCLRRLCREEGLPDLGKAATLNDSLRDKGRYTQPQWRRIQSWLDIGNSAAHGKFSAYSDADVAQMIDDVERFVAQELGT